MPGKMKQCPTGPDWLACRKRTRLPIGPRMLLPFRIPLKSGAQAKPQGGWQTKCRCGWQGHFLVRGLFRWIFADNPLPRPRCLLLSALQFRPLLFVGCGTRLAARDVRLVPRAAAWLEAVLAPSCGQRLGLDLDLDLQLFGGGGWAIHATLHASPNG